MSSIKLSIISPCRNEFPNIVFTFYSIMHCLEAEGWDTKHEVEFIIVDNASTDTDPIRPGTRGTTSYLMGRGAFYNSIIRVIYDPLAGNHSARNKGAAIARGEYLFFTDGHMCYKPGFFRSIVKTVDETGGLVHGALQFMGAYPPMPESTGYAYTLKLGEEIKGCVDEETELLTPFGWKKYSDFTADTPLVFVTVNPETREVEIQNASGLASKEYKGEMIEIKGRSYDALLTPNHRTIRGIRNEKKDCDEWEIVPAKDITKKNALPLGTNGVNWGMLGIVNGQWVSDEMVELIGWIITEGCYNKKDKWNNATITITQYGYLERAEIERLLQLCNISYSIKKDKKRDFKIHQTSTRQILKILPKKELTFDFLGCLPRRQLEKLYNVLIKADGISQPTNESFIQVNQTTIDAFQYLCVLLGKASKWYIKKPSVFKGNHYGKKNINVVSVKENKYTSGFSVRKKQYHGIIWCPTVPNGTVFARRNGHVYPTGQTWNNYRLADSWWYVPAQGHWGLAVKREQFLDFGGYPKVHRTYGGGEFYTDIKWWMFGSTVATDPNAIGYHLAAGRGYSYDHSDYIENVLGMAYALGLDDWRERAYINALRKTNPEKLEALMRRNEREYAEDRKFVQSRRVWDFNTLLVKRPWDILNDNRHGKHNGMMTIFHDTWLKLIREGDPDNGIKPSPIAVAAYENSQYQAGLEKFINENLSQYVFRRQK